MLKIDRPEWVHHCRDSIRHIPLSANQLQLFRVDSTPVYKRNWLLKVDKSNKMWTKITEFRMRQCIYVHRQLIMKIYFQFLKCDLAILHLLFMLIIARCFKVGKLQHTLCSTACYIHVSMRGCMHKKCTEVFVWSWPTIWKPDPWENRTVGSVPDRPVFSGPTV